MVTDRMWCYDIWISDGSQQQKQATTINQITSNKSRMPPGWLPVHKRLAMQMMFVDVYEK